MNQEQAGKILRANVKSLPEPLKSAVEFTLATFYALSAADTAKKFLASCIPGDKQFGFKALGRIFNVNDATIANVYYGKTYKDFT